MPSLLNLPLELLGLMLENLELQDIFRICSTCRYLRQAFRPDCLVKIVQNLDTPSTDVRDAIAESSYVLRCHALLAACESGTRADRDALARSGASLARIEYGRKLELAICQGNQKLVTSLLRHGATTQRLPNGIDPIVAKTLDKNDENDGLTPAYECLVDAMVQEEDWKGVNLVIDRCGYMEFLPPHLADYCQSHYVTEPGWVASVLDNTSDGMDRVLDNMLLQGLEVEGFLKSAKALDKLLGSDRQEGHWSRWVRAAIDDDEDLTIEGEEARGDAPLVAAASEGLPGFSKMLIALGARVDCPSERFVSPLYAAARMGRSKVVKVLLEAGADASIIDHFGSTALHLAAYMNHKACTRKLVKHGADLYARDIHGWTPLFHAAHNGAAEAVQVLINAGTDLKTPSPDTNGDYWNPLHMAASKGHRKILKMLLRAGADPWSRTEEGFYPIHLAAFHGHMPCMEILPSHGVDLGVTNGNGASAIHMAAERGQLSVVEWLVDHGVEIDVKGVRGVTALHCAALNGHVDVVRWLSHHGAVTSTRNVGGATPLFYAVSGGCEETAQFLVDQGVEVNLVNEDNLTPLLVAASKGVASVVRMLLDHGAVPDFAMEGTRALHVACMEGHTAVVKELVEYHADVNVQDSNGATPLQLAALRGHTEIAELLLDLGAVVDTFATGAGLTAIHAAALGGHEDITEMLIARGARLNIHGLQGWLPIHFAADGGHEDVTRLLLAHDSEVDPRGLLGQTPLHLAALRGHVEVAKILIKHGAQSSAQNDVGWTPLYYAAMGGDEGTVDLFKKEKVQRDIFRRTPLHRALTFGHDGVARQLAHQADSTIDGYGRTVSDWAALIGKSPLLGHQAPVEDTVTETRLHRSVCELAKRLLETKSRATRIGFHELGHCLAYLEEHDDAILSFQQQVTKVQDGEAMYEIGCRGCEENIKGIRFVCEDCPEVDFCATCANTPPRNEVMEICEAHDLLEVKEPPPVLGDDIPLDVQDWLRGLITKHEALGGEKV